MVALFFRADNLGYNPGHPAFAINTATSSKERTERKQTQNTNQQIDSSADSFIRFTVELGKNDPHQTDWSKPNCTHPQNHDEADLCQQIGMRHTAYYTFGLGIAQKFLAVVTLIGLIASILYAGRAANAARNSANALPRLERAYVTLTFECTAGKTTKGEIDIWRFTTVFQFENLGKPPAVVKQINFSTPVAEDKNMIPDYDELLNDWEILIKSGGIHPDRKHKRLITSPKNYIKRERFYSNRIERDISLEELRHILTGEGGSHIGSRSLR